MVSCFLPGLPVRSVPVCSRLSPQSVSSHERQRKSEDYTRGIGSRSPLRRYISGFETGYKLIFDVGLLWASMRSTPPRCPLKIIEICHTLGYKPTNNQLSKCVVKNNVVAGRGIIENIPPARTNRLTMTRSTIARLICCFVFALASIGGIG